MTERNDLSRNHYEVLGLDQDASAAEIKASYKKLLLLVGKKGRQPAPA